ncbi:hypothetical protein GIB67_004680 [Kingdonia uniflora]|uniref:Response regulatory domain-containing protein n=1 Tax=Kingdonia uniflora TaxID=39325 RepID=A0A7J7P4U2_9MAGN|nr:hypothetical protein GIB67_004680 [Kingdonia uniflora]
MATETIYPKHVVDSQQLHVLAVDDSLVDRKVIERLLKISSFKVTTVDSGKRALQYLGLDGEKSSAGFDGLKVNLIITDYWMPGMTGYELLKKIKESSTFREVPVVIMSSESVLTRINRCLEEGAEEFIVKPVQLSDVKRLKNNIKREEVSVVVTEEHVPIVTHKRKFHETMDSSTTERKIEDATDDSTSDISILSASTSPTSSASSSTSTSSSPLNSPSRRIKTCDDSD